MFTAMAESFRKSMLIPKKYYPLYIANFAEKDVGRGREAGRENSIPAK